MNRKIIIISMSMLLTWTLVFSFNSYYISKSLVGINYNQRVYVESKKSNLPYEDFFQVRPNEESTDIYYSSEKVKQDLLEFYDSQSKSLYLIEYNLLPYNFNDYVGEYFVNCDELCMENNYQYEIIDTSEEFMIPKSLIINFLIIISVFTFLMCLIKIIDAKNNMTKRTTEFLYSKTKSNLKMESLELIIYSNLSVVIVTFILKVAWTLLGIAIFECIILFICFLNIIIDYYFNKYLFLKQYKFFIKGLKMKQTKKVILFLGIFNILFSYVITILISGNINLISEFYFYNDSFLENKVQVAGSYGSFTEYSDTGNTNLITLASQNKDEGVYYFDYDNMGSLTLNHNMYSVIFQEDLDKEKNYQFSTNELEKLVGFEFIPLEKDLKIKNYTKSKSECKKCYIQNMIVTSDEKLLISDNYILDKKFEEKNSGSIYLSATEIKNQIFLDFQFFNMRYISFLFIIGSTSIVLFRLTYKYYLDSIRNIIINIILYSGKSINEIILSHFKIWFFLGICTSIFSLTVGLVYSIIILLSCIRINKKLSSTKYLRGIE